MGLKQISFSIQILFSNWHPINQLAIL